MKCFFHQDRDAVGICKSCGRGICSECAFDLGKGIACRGRCEQDARDVIQLVERGVQTNPKMISIVRKARTTGLLSAGLFILLGIVFLVLGFASASAGRPVLFEIAIGSLFFLYGIISLIRTLATPKVR